MVCFHFLAQERLSQIVKEGSGFLFHMAKGHSYHMGSLVKENTLSYFISPSGKCLHTISIVYQCRTFFWMFGNLAILKSEYYMGKNIGSMITDSKAEESLVVPDFFLSSFFFPHCTHLKCPTTSSLSAPVMRVARKLSCPWIC